MRDNEPVRKIIFHFDRSEIIFENNLCHRLGPVGSALNCKIGGRVIDTALKQLSSNINPLSLCCLRANFNLHSGKKCCKKHNSLHFTKDSFSTQIVKFCHNMNTSVMTANNTTFVLLAHSVHSLL